MKKIIPILVSLAVLAACDARRSDKIAESMPLTPENVKDINAAPPTTVQIIDSLHNFGTVAEGAVVEFSFRFKNIGDKPLIVSNATASCGCTVPEKPEKPIMPGEIGYIKAKFNTEGKPNHAHKAVNITSNARPEFPPLVLEGEVTPKQ